MIKWKQQGTNAGVHLFWMFQIGRHTCFKNSITLPMESESYIWLIIYNVKTKSFKFLKNIIEVFSI